MERKLVYGFGAGRREANAKMTELLGGKGANLAEMSNIGLPVPAGFTITTKACQEYFENGREVSPDHALVLLDPLQCR